METAPNAKCRMLRGPWRGGEGRGRASNLIWDRDVEGDDVEPCGADSLEGIGQKLRLLGNVGEDESGGGKGDGDGKVEGEGEDEGVGEGEGEVTDRVRRRWRATGQGDWDDGHGLSVGKLWAECRTEFVNGAGWRRRREGTL